MARSTPERDLYALRRDPLRNDHGATPARGPDAGSPFSARALVTTPAPRLRDVFVNAPPRLDEIMARLLATLPADRPSSALEVAHELREIAGDLGPNPGDELTRGSGGRESFPAVDRTGGSRLVTTIVATHLPKGAPRARLLTHLRARGADATELGGDAIVCHLGVRKTLGDEAVQALDLGPPRREARRDGRRGDRSAPASSIRDPRARSWTARPRSRGTPCEGRCSSTRRPPN